MSEREISKDKEIRLAKAREYKKAHRERLLLQGKIYNAHRRSTIEKREKVNSQNRESNKRNADKRKNYKKNIYGDKQRAQQVIRNLIYRGRLIRDKCVFCGIYPSDAHHEDYSLPRAIVWLCRQHHKDVHAGGIVITKEQIINV